MHIRLFPAAALGASLAVSFSLLLTFAPQAQDGAVLRGKAAFGSWHDDAPGKRLRTVHHLSFTISSFVV